MKKSVKLKLKLEKETLRHLETGAAMAVYGGDVIRDTDNPGLSCQRLTCSNAV